MFRSDWSLTSLYDVHGEHCSHAAHSGHGVNRIDGINGVDRADRADRVDRVDRADRVDRIDRVDRVDGVWLRSDRHRSPRRRDRTFSGLFRPCRPAWCWPCSQFSPPPPSAVGTSRTACTYVEALYVEECDECTLSKPPRSSSHRPQGPTIGRYPFDLLYADILDMSNTSDYDAKNWQRRAQAHHSSTHLKGLTYSQNGVCAVFVCSPCVGPYCASIVHLHSMQKRLGASRCAMPHCV